MLRLDLKDRLEAAANNYAAIRDILSEISAFILIVELCRLDLQKFNQFLQTLYGEPESKERSFFKAFTHHDAVNVTVRSASCEDFDDTFDDKIFLYALWVLVCPFNDIDRDRLKYTINNFSVFEGLNTARIKIWLQNVYQYLVSPDDWELIQNDESLIGFINKIMEQRKSVGVDKVYLNLANTELRDMRLSNKNYEAAQLEATQWSQTILESTRFTQANLKNANFSGSILEDCDFSHAILNGTNFNEAVFESMDLSKVDFTHARLTKARFINVNFFERNVNIFMSLANLTKYETHPDFEVLRAAILDNFIARVHEVEYDQDKIRHLEIALNTRIFGRPRTSGRRNFNEFFADSRNNHNYAENSIYTSSQRRIRSELNAIREKIKNLPPLRLEAGQSLYVLATPSLK